MGKWSVAGRRVGTPVGRATGAVIEGLEARCLLSAVLFVDDSAVGSGDGSNWENAFTDLQLALSQAVYGDEIHIAGGTYRPTATTDRTISFELKDGVSLLGGYAGYGPGDPDVHDVALYPTVLSGDIGAAGDSTDNSYHVIASKNVSSMTVLDGITITGGHADGDWTDSYGGGMYNYTSSPTLTNCVFRGNAADGYGGGMYNYMFSSPTLIECTFSGNTAGGSGGGMCNDSSSPSLTNCTFVRNVASGGGVCSGYGGGIYSFDGSSPRLDNCTFSGNSASGSGGSSGFGGGMYNSYGSPVLTDCTFSANTASSSSESGGRGGGMYNTSCSASLSECTFSANTASGTGDSNGYGGGMYNTGCSSLTLTNCTFSGNAASGSGIASGYGGGMYNACSPTMTNCVLSGNTAGGSGDYSGCGGGMYNDYGGSPVLTNCTLSRNTASGGGASSGYGGGIYNNACSPTVTDCMLNGNTASGSGRSSGYGGGIYNSGRSVPVLTNCAFSGNRANGGIRSTGEGGGIYDEPDSVPWLINCTLSSNSAKGSGAAVYNYSSQFLHLTNCIVWGSGDRPIYDGSNTAIITYGDIQGGYAGSGNIKADPLFVRSPSSGADGVWGTADDDYGDLRLQLGSPCVDVGDNTAFGYVDITTDLAGNPRFIGGTVDLGAYEGAVPSVGTAFGAQHSLTLTDTDSDIVRIGISGGGEGMLLTDKTIALTGTTAKSVLTIAVKKGDGGDGLFHLSGITSDGPLKGINASAVVLSGQVQINRLNQNVGKGSVSLKLRAISDADVLVQGMPVSAITVGDIVSDSRIVATGSIGKFSATTLLNSDILVGVATGFDGRFAGHGDFANLAAKLGSLKVTGRKLPKGQTAPAYVISSHVSAPSVATVTLLNVAATSDAIVHVMTDAGVLKVSQTTRVAEEMVAGGTWRKAGERPGIWEVV